VKYPTSLILVYVSRFAVRGLVIKLIIGGLLPMCVMLLNIATFEIPSLDFVAIKLADLYPVHEFIKFNLGTECMLFMASLEKFIIINFYSKIPFV
jgi:hypothetical protein